MKHRGVSAPLFSPPANDAVGALSCTSCSAAYAYRKRADAGEAPRSAGERDRRPPPLLRWDRSSAVGDPEISPMRIAHRSTPPPSWWRVYRAHMGSSPPPGGAKRVDARRGASDSADGRRAIIALGIGVVVGLVVATAAFIVEPATDPRHRAGHRGAIRRCRRHAKTHRSPARRADPSTARASRGSPFGDRPHHAARLRRARWCRHVVRVQRLRVAVPHCHSQRDRRRSRHLLRPHRRDDFRRHALAWAPSRRGVPLHAPPGRRRRPPPSSHGSAVTMDTSGDPTDTQRELRELRARAYGPAADIDGDPAALARLAELERLQRQAHSSTELPQGAPENRSRTPPGPPRAAVDVSDHAAVPVSASSSSASADSVIRLLPCGDAHDDLRRHEVARPPHRRGLPIHPPRGCRGRRASASERSLTWRRRAARPTRHASCAIYGRAHTVPPQTSKVTRWLSHVSPI